MKDLIRTTDRIRKFRDQHRPGRPLVLVNVWDVGSAVAVAEAGASAIATSSWAVAAAAGIGDGEQLGVEHTIDLARRIVERVSVPVSVDFEAGYADSAAAVGGNVRRLAETGAVGCNLEDPSTGPTAASFGLRPVGEQVARLAAARAGADAVGAGFFVNARTDVFMNEPDAGESGITEVISRAKAYAEAGADGLFVPGLQDVDLVRQIVEASPLPVNVMVGATDSVATMTAAGVSRISFGPAPYLAAMQSVAATAGVIARLADAESDWSGA